MAKRSFFKDDNINYQEYLKSVQVMMGNEVYFGSKATIEKGVESLAMIKEDERQKKMIACSVLIDKMYNQAGTFAGNSARKLPIIMTLSNLIANYYESIDNLTDVELVTLSGFLYTLEPQYMDSYLEFFSNKEILSETVIKTNAPRERHNILSAIEDKYFEFAMDCEDKNKIEMFQKESVNVIKNSSLATLLSMVTPFSVVMEELEKEEIRK